MRDAVLVGVIVLLTGLHTVRAAEGQGGAKAPEPAAVKLPAKENFHLFILAGQSNMIGVSPVTPEDKKPHPRVLMLNAKGEWVPAVDPVHVGYGVCLGRTFGIELAESDPAVTVGLIPCAVGGSNTGEWLAENRTQFGDAMKKARLAMDKGTLKAILWHQGEGDASGGEAKTYGERIKKLIQKFRDELKMPRLPFIVGELLPVLPRPFVADVNAALKAVPKNVPDAAFVSVEGLKDNGDKTHLDAASTRELGKRYLAAYLAMTRADKDAKPGPAAPASGGGGEGRNPGR